ncbi:filament-like plant protein 7 [Euphorbia lathyris]|uniref:filament-like plant protein 7 n=1 Tax=Euphorbia lathyris TaxID=212925 RepID=UPI003313944E
MDNKSWLWRKKSSEKTIVATDKFGIFVKGIDQEIQKLPMAKEVGSLKSVRSLNEKLASVLLDSHGKDDKQESLAPEDDIAGQDKKEDVVCLKEELDESTKQDIDANAKLIHPDVAMKHSKESNEFEKTRKRLEEKLMETSKRVADLAIENANLNKVLVFKEAVVEELHTRSSQTSAELKALMGRLDSIEKENAFLKYEFYMLEKELEVRSEELEYTRRSADASHRQQLESVRKLAMLESECQRLRVLIRKKLPGPAGLMPGREPIESRRKPNPVRDLVLRDATLDRSPEVSVKNIDFLIEQLRGMEEENRTLKGILSKKNAELQSSRVMYSKNASRLSQAEVQKSTNLAKRSPVPAELYPIAGFDTCSDDGGSSSGSWANALMSELEHFQDVKSKSPSDCKVSDISLMDDFAEMERLAIVSGGSDCSSAGKELVPVNDIAGEKSLDWLQQVLNAILKQQRVTKQSLSELLEDIKIALGYVNHAHDNSAKATSRQESLSNLNTSICKIVKLIEEINASNSRTDNVSKREESSPDYFFRVLRWKSSELSNVLQQFVRTCNDMLNGKAALECFVEEVAFTLNWIMSNSVAPKDATSTRGTEAGLLHYPRLEVDAFLVFREQFEINASSCNDKIRVHTTCRESNLQEENKRLLDELKNMESERKVAGVRLRSATDKIENLMVQLQESKQSIENLQLELETTKASNGMIEDEMENQKSINEDLDTQLTVAKAKLNEVLQKFSSLEVEFEEKNNCCEELEVTCLELQLQLESVARKDSVNYNINEGAQTQNGSEITAASLKLAECQETIFNLGKQLKALATPREVAIFDKVFNVTSSTTTTTASVNKNSKRRFSLHDQMAAEDSAKAITNRASEKDATTVSNNKTTSSAPSVSERTSEAKSDSNVTPGNTSDVSLAIVPSKKQSVGLLKRLLMRRKNRSSKKSQSLGKV